MKCIEVATVKVVVPQTHRTTNASKVKALTESILAVGLQHPIGITPEYRLIHGRHRLEAYNALGWDKIPAVIHKLDDLHSELAEIDENLARNALTALQESQALKRRKAIYETLHPEAKHGGAPGKSGGGKKAKEDNVSSFADDTAVHTGRTPRSVRRDVAIAASIPEDIQEMIADSPIADSKAELRKLAKLPEDEQRKVAGKLADGTADTVAAATGKARKPRRAKVKPDDAWDKIHDAVVDWVASGHTYKEAVKRLRQLAKEFQSDKETA